VDTPFGSAEVEFVDPSQPITCVPLLPAGLVLLEQAAALLPAQRTCHFGVGRSGPPFLNALPPSLTPADRVLITDPLIATGAWRVRAGCAPTADTSRTRAGEELCACLDELLRRGADVKSIRVVAAVAAPPALKRLSEEYPGESPAASTGAELTAGRAGLRLFVATIDEVVDEAGRIVPGLGDAAQRAFGS